jgi:hypothetical protein
MTNSGGKTTITMRRKTRVRLAILKQEMGCRSMDQLLNKLLDEKEGKA